MSKNSDAAIALLEKHFDIAFAAPDGIKKLRELILSLAMQGKLVAQDSSDQPASELLKEIEAEKERLIKEGKIKKSKPLPEIKPDEVPYDLPKGWKWVRMGCVGSFERGRSKHRPRNDQCLFSNGSYPFVQTGDVSKAKYTNNEILACSSYYNNFGLQQSRLWAKGTLCITIAANIAETGFLGMEACIPDSVVAFLSIDETLSKFVKFFIDVAKQDLEHFAPSTAQKNINLGIINDLIFPLPPLDEQRRIVAKIDELMARCDELEKLRGDRDRKQITVHNSALNRLLIAKEQSDFNTAWQFITQHFGELYSVKENVTELRKAILQLAVMGKLVPQYPNDQPASELLKEIEKEKERLEGKTKNSYKLVKIEKNEHLFEIPASWRWTRCENLAKFIDPQPSHRTPPEYENGVPYIGYSDINHVKGINFSGARKVSPKVLEEHRQRYQLNLGDFVFGKIGTLGQPFFLTEPFDYCLSANLILIQPNLSIVHPKYLAVFLESPSFSDFLNENKTNSTHGVFGIKKARLICLPLPPLAEQHRIVAKIDQLMALCDNLEKQIDAANSKQTNLLNAVMTKI